MGLPPHLFIFAQNRAFLAKEGSKKAVDTVR